MSTEPSILEAPPEAKEFPAIESPFLHAPEGVKTIFMVMIAAACLPLAAGLVFFGWRAAGVAVISVAACATIEKLFYRVTRTPAMLGRTHAFLTGLLLALTLPPFVPWYVPLIAAAFAIIVGKAVFGGVGHFLWQPALVGLLAVTVLFPEEMNPSSWPILARNKILIGDVRNYRPVERHEGWERTPAAPGADAIQTKTPVQMLAGLTNRREPAFSGLFVPAEIERAKPAALTELPPINDMIYGGHPGGIGETCSIAILLAGLYLIYRNFVKWQLPAAFLASAWCVLAVAPVFLAAPNGTVRTVWWPLASEGFDVGLTYINYHLFGGELLLAAFFLAPEMTSRPTTTGGQVIFGLLAGAAAMILRLYVSVPIPCYMAVLAVNTLTPAIDAAWRPRVFGARRLPWLLLRRIR